jgi:hypothetical protein
LPKLILFSILLVSVFAATRLSTTRVARKGVRNVQMICGIFVFIWAYMCLNWYPALVPVEESIKRDDKGKTHHTDTGH